MFLAEIDTLHFLYLLNLYFNVLCRLSKRLLSYLCVGIHGQEVSCVSVCILGKLYYRNINFSFNISNVKLCKTSKTSENQASFSFLLIQRDILCTILLTTCLKRNRMENNTNITLPETYNDVASY